MTQRARRHRRRRFGRAVSDRWPLTIRGTGLVIVALASFVLAQTWGSRELVYVTVLLVALLAFSLLWLRITRRARSVVRTLSSSTVPVGTLVRIRLGVRMRRQTPVGSWWRDRTPTSVDADAAGWLPGMQPAPAGAARAWVYYEALALRRGRHTLGPVVVGIVDPFGIARRTQTLPGTSDLLTVPQAVELDGDASGASDSDRTSPSSVYRLGQGADDLVARPYASGDSMRRVHWRATAHRGELMVRQEEQEHAPAALVVLDLALARWGEVATRASGVDEPFEVALTAAISVARHMALNDMSVRMLDTDGDEIGALTGSTAGELSGLLARCATLVAHGAAPLAEITRQLAGGQTGPVVVVTGRLTAEDAASLAPAAASSQQSILLAVSPQPNALAIASASGWRTAEIANIEDLQAAWPRLLDRQVARAL